MPRPFLGRKAEFAQLSQLRRFNVQIPVSGQPQLQPQRQQKGGAKARPLGFQDDPAGFCAQYLQPCLKAFQKFSPPNFSTTALRHAALALLALPGCEWQPAAMYAVQHLPESQVYPS